MTKIIDQFCLEESLGSNYYGFDVFRARHVQTNEFFLVKCLSRTLYETPGYFREALDVELKVIKRINHINLIRFVKSLKTANNTYIVYEWCNGGSLFDHITKSKPTEMEQTNYMRQLLLAIRQLHSCNIVHLNLHPRNIYLGRDNNLKITNFAHSRDLKDTESSSYRTDKFRFKEYLAPEVLESSSPGIAADIYQLGLVFAFIKYGRIDNLIIQQPLRIKNGEHLADMIQQMTCKDPLDRDDLDTVKARLGLGSNSKTPMLSSSKSSSRLPKTQRKISEDYSESSKMKQQTSSTLLPPSNQPSIDGSVGSKKSTTLNVKGLLSPPTMSKSDREISDVKSEADFEHEQSVVGKEVKRLVKERNKYNYLLMIANDVMVQNLTNNSVKLYFLISKKALLNAKALDATLVKLEGKRKGTPWEQVAVMSKLISHEVGEVQQFVGALTKFIMSTEKRLISMDSALELEVTEEDSLNQAFLRKLIKEYVTNVLAKVDISRREDEETSQKLLMHVNNVSDVQILDKFFATYINDSVVNLLDQVYFGELEKMEVRELQRFVLEKLAADKII